MTCRIEDCIKPPCNSRGWCWNHYTRWRRHGNPLAGRTTPGEPERFYRETVLTYDGDECLAWPYSKSGKGYGTLWIGGRSVYVHRRVCEVVNGPAPTTDHEAAHSCGKGHEACVTKGHVSWKTSAGNKADKVDHGTHNRGERHGLSKLNEAKVRQILALLYAGELSQRAIAKQIGVSASTVWLIKEGKVWGWLEEIAA